MLLPPPPSTPNLGLSKPDFTLVMIWMSPSIHDNDNDKNKHMSLYIHCEATEQSFTWYFKYSSSYDYFYVYILPPESQNLGLYKQTFMPVMVWMSPSIHDEGKCMSIYDNYKVTEQSSPWYFKYSSSYCNLYTSTLAPKSKILAYPSHISRQLWSEWAHPSIHYKGKCMSLHNHCEAVEQSLTKCIKYSSSYNHFHDSTLTLQIPKSWPNPIRCHASCGQNEAIHPWSRQMHVIV